MQRLKTHMKSYCYYYCYYKTREIIIHQNHALSLFTSQNHWNFKPIYPIDCSTHVLMLSLFSWACVVCISQSAVKMKTDPLSIPPPTLHPAGHPSQTHPSRPLLTCPLLHPNLCHSVCRSLSQSWGAPVMISNDNVYVMLMHVKGESKPQEVEQLQSYCVCEVEGLRSLHESNVTLT